MLLLHLARISIHIDKWIIYEMFSLAYSFSFRFPCFFFQFDCILPIQAAHSKSIYLLNIFFLYAFFSHSTPLSVRIPS